MTDRANFCELREELAVTDRPALQLQSLQPFTVEDL